LRLANHGFTKEEIAEQITLPDSLGHEFYNRDYYGTVHHNSRAVYVKYLGYFNGNPATLHPLPQREAGRRYIEYMGGEGSIVNKAQDSFEQGDYRWVVEVLNHIMMVNPDNTQARALQADALEQLGYQAESGPWRNFYLCGALELRNGLPGGSQFRASEGIAQGMPLPNLFQLMAVRLLPEKAKDLTLNIVLSEPEQVWVLQIKHQVLHAFAERREARPTATLTLSTLDFKRLMLGVTNAVDLMSSQALSIEGDVGALSSLGEMFDSFSRRFPIMTPR